MRKERKRGEKIGKEAISNGKSVYEIIEFNHFIGKRIWQYDKSWSNICRGKVKCFEIKMTMQLKTIFLNKI